MTLKLVDISAFQHTNTPIDFAALKAAGYVGVIIKFTESYKTNTGEATYTDPYVIPSYKRDWAREAKNVGLIVMPYHFCHSNVSISFQVNALKGYLSEFGCMWLDEEVSDGQNMSLVAKTFLALDKEVNGLAQGHVGRYTYPSFLTQLNNNGDNSSLPMWLADPSNVATNVPRVMTQTGQGYVPGISAMVDLDVWEGDLISLHGFAGMLPESINIINTESGKTMAYPSNSSNNPIVAVLGSIDGKGYALIASDGGVFTYGDMPFEGSAGAIKLNAPIVSASLTDTGKGYWLFAADGGVFTYGDAKFFGSAAAGKVSAPIVSAFSYKNEGYWLAASDGNVYAFGACTFAGRAVYK